MHEAVPLVIFSCIPSSHTLVLFLWKTSINTMEKKTDNRFIARWPFLWHEIMDVYLVQHQTEIMNPLLTDVTCKGHDNLEAQLSASRLASAEKETWFLNLNLFLTYVQKYNDVHIHWLPYGILINRYCIVLKSYLLYHGSFKLHSLGFVGYSTLVLGIVTLLCGSCTLDLLLLFKCDAHTHTHQLCLSHYPSQALVVNTPFSTFFQIPHMSEIMKYSPSCAWLISFAINHAIMAHFTSIPADVIQFVKELIVFYGIYVSHENLNSYNLNNKKHII